MKQSKKYNQFTGSKHCWLFTKQRKTIRCMEFFLLNCANWKHAGDTLITFGVIPPRMAGMSSSEGHGNYQQTPTNKLSWIIIAQFVPLPGASWRARAASWPRPPGRWSTARWCCRPSTASARLWRRSAPTAGSGGPGRRWRWRPGGEGGPNRIERRRTRGCGARPAACSPAMKHNNNTPHLKTCSVKLMCKLRVCL